MFVRNLLPYHGRRQETERSATLKSPYELRFGIKPDLKFLGIIRSDAYVVL